MNDATPIKVLVIHEDPLVCAGLVTTLRDQPGFELVGVMDFDRYSCNRPSDQRVDVVVADYDYGIELVASARMQPSRRQSGPNVLIVTTRQSEREIRHAMEQGARGYLVQGCGLTELVDAVRALNSGLRHIGALAARRLADSVSGQSLTDRENDVLRLLVEGHGNKTIARQLDIAMGTVKSHLKTIFQKLDANSRTEVAAVAERRGLLTIPAGAPHGPALTVRHREQRYAGAALAMANIGSLQ